MPLCVVEVVIIAELLDAKEIYAPVGMVELLKPEKSMVHPSITLSLAAPENRIPCTIAFEPECNKYKLLICT